MLWVLAGCALLALLVPPAVAVAEGMLSRGGPRDVGFWALARSVAGTCHVPWGRRGSPVVRFPLPDGEARGRAVRLPARRGWLVEVRAYQKLPFGFAARICSPPGRPARWRAPGLAPLWLYPEEREHLGEASLETTDERLLRWVLRHAETRRALDGLAEAAHARATEVLLGGSVVVVRGVSPAGLSAGDAVELLGPGLVDALRRLSADLNDLGAALLDAGDRLDATALCRGCGATLGDDPWPCPGCGRALHRGCREMLGGCATPDCARVPDPLPPAPGRGATPA